MDYCARIPVATSQDNYSDISESSIHGGFQNGTGYIMVPFALILVVCLSIFSDFVSVIRLGYFLRPPDFSIVVVSFL